jgi:hypothetical protein
MVDSRTLCPPADEFLDVRQVVREAFAAGTLWRLDNPMVIAGYGSGLPCRLCGNPIVKSDVQYDLTGPKGGEVRTHLPCFNAWNDESKVGGAGLNL